MGSEETGKMEWVVLEKLRKHQASHHKERYRTMGRINHVIGFCFQERGVPNETGIMAHWLDDKYVPWLKIRIKNEDDFFYFQWEPMSITMKSSIAPKVGFYVLKEGLIHQDRC